MSTTPSRINPDLLNFFLRKKQLEQQNAWNERMPGGESVGDAVSRIAPYAGDEPKAGSWRDFIQNAPQVDAQPVINRGMNPMARVAEMPVTDTLTPDRPENYGFQTPEIGRQAITATTPIINAAQNYQPPPDAITRQRTVTPQTPTIASSSIIDAARGYQPGRALKESYSNTEPIEGAPDVRNIPPDKIQAAIAPLINTQLNIPLETSSEMGAGQPQIVRPQPYERLANGAVPISAEDTTVRPRITDPSQFLINRAIGSLTDQPTYGFDKNGQPRTEAKRGFWGRAGAFAKAEGEGLLEGRGLLPSLPNAVHAAINPDINAKQRLEREQGKNLQAAVTQLGMEREQAQVADIKAQAQQRTQSPLTRDMQARRAAVLRTVATQKYYKQGQNPALDAEIAATGTPVGEFDNRRDPNANKMAIVHENQTYMVTPKQALDYSMGQDVELSPGNFVRLTPGQQAGYYGQMGGRAQQAGEFNVTQQRLARENNAKEKQKEAESIAQMQEDDDYNARVQKNIDDKLTRATKLKEDAAKSASPSEQRELEKEAEHLQESAEDKRLLLRAKRTKYVPNLMDEGSVEVPKAGTARTPATSGAPKSGVTQSGASRYP